MSTTSPNFGFILATASDTVNVVAHVANNFSTLDTILSGVITTGGALKASLPLTTPALTNPTITGSLAGAFSMAASTGTFFTITATGGLLTVNTFNIGTYALPATIGASSFVLTVVTNNAVWAAGVPNTGANLGLSNLAAVAINTNLNTFSAGFVTVDRLVASSGALTGLTTFQATTGTFAGAVTISGTLTANVVNCTGGTSTFAGLSVGTYAFPGTLGSTGQVLRVAASTLGFASATSPAVFCYSQAASNNNVNNGTTATLLFNTKVYDPTNLVASSVFTATTAGIYRFLLGSLSLSVTGSALGSVGLIIAGTTRSAVDFNNASGTFTNLHTVMVASMASGDTARAFLVVTAGAGSAVTTNALNGTAANMIAYFCGEQLFQL